MQQNIFFDRASFIVAGAVFVISTLLFFLETGMFLKSAGAALICTALVWVSYTAIRWIILAAKS